MPASSIACAIALSFFLSAISSAVSPSRLRALGDAPAFERALDAGDVGVARGGEQPRVHGEILSAARNVDNGQQRRRDDGDKGGNTTRHRDLHRSSTFVRRTIDECAAELQDQVLPDFGKKDYNAPYGEAACIVLRFAWAALWKQHSNGMGDL